MSYKFKNIKRAKLYPRLNSVCKCRGIIDRNTQVWGSFGVNDGNNHRILLVGVFVENIFVDHVWVKAKELNDQNKYQIGTEIVFDAYIHSYQRINGDIGLGLFDLKNIGKFSKLKN